MKAIVSQWWHDAGKQIFVTHSCAHNRWRKDGISDEKIVNIMRTVYALNSRAVCWCVRDFIWFPAGLEAFICRSRITTMPNEFSTQTWLTQFLQRWVTIWTKIERFASIEDSHFPNTFTNLHTLPLTFRYKYIITATNLILQSRARYIYWDRTVDDQNIVFILCHIFII